MKELRHPFTIRITSPQIRLLAKFAADRGIPEYQARHRIFELGLKEAFAVKTSSTEAELLSLVEETLARLERLEKLSDRILWTSVSSYTCSQFLAHKGGTNPSQLNETLSQASMDAYRRQLEAARAQK